MVYIEMTKEEKTKGKAAVDLMGSQIGKSGASLSLQAVFLFAGGLGGALPVIGAVYLVMCVVWLWAVGCDRSLSPAEARPASKGCETASCLPAPTPLVFRSD